MKILGLDGKYCQDLEFFLKYANSMRGIENDNKFPNERIHLDFYLNHSEEELYKFINSYLEKYKVNNDYDFYYMMNCIIKYMSSYSDSHTKIYKKDNIWFPIKFKVINNNVFIDRCFDEKYLRKKIKKINGIDISLIISQIKDCTSYGTENWLLFNIEKVLSNRNDLLSLPCINDKDNKIIFELDNSEILSFEIDKINNDYKLYPKKNNDQYKIIDNVLIFKYPACKEDFKPDMEQIINVIKNNGIDKFVLDLRGNSGGNSEIIKELIIFLSNSNLELITLVDRMVFSSGRFAAIDMKRIGSKIIGENIGTPVNCFGYVSGNGITPNSNFNFNFSRVYWYEEEGHMRGIYTKEELDNCDKDFFEPKYLDIDISIEVKEDEYIDSFDSIFFNKCLENIISNKKTK